MEYELRIARAGTPRIVAQLTKGSVIVLMVCAAHSRHGAFGVEVASLG